MLSLLFTSRLGVAAREAVLPLINDWAMSLVLAANGGHSLDFGVLTRYKIVIVSILPPSGLYCAQSNG